MTLLSFIQSVIPGAMVLLILIASVIKIDKAVRIRARQKMKIIPTCPPNRPISNEQAKEEEHGTEESIWT